MSIYLPTPPFETDPKIYSWKEVLGEKSSDIRFGGKYENALEHYCSSSPSERLRPKLGFLWKPIRHYCFSPRWQHTNLNLSYLGAKSFSQDQQIWMLYMRKSFSGDHQIWILYLVTNQTPRIPYSCYCYCYCYCSVTKSALWQYLGNQAW